jgi:hypothetical protein
MRYLRLASPKIISGPFIKYCDAIQFRGFLKLKMIGAQNAHSMINSVIFDKYLFKS